MNWVSDTFSSTIFFTLAVYCQFDILREIISQRRFSYLQRPKFKDNRNDDLGAAE
jgi:hypothetical protein